MKSASKPTQISQYEMTLGGGSWTTLAIPGGTGVVVTPDTPTAGIDQVVVTVPKGSNTKLFGHLQVVK